MYRDMGADRSLSKLAQQLGRSKTLLSRWSVRHSWQQRVDAVDRSLDEERWRTTQREATEMAERHARAAVSMQARALQGLQLVKPEELTPRDLTYMLDIAVKIERLARGQPSERIELIGVLVTPLVQQFSAIFLEVNEIEDGRVRLEQFAARADVVMEEVIGRFLVQQRGNG